jgi:hypothetical protein
MSPTRVSATRRFFFGGSDLVSGVSVGSTDELARDLDSAASAALVAVGGSTRLAGIVTGESEGGSPAPCMDGVGGKPAIDVLGVASGVGIAPEVVRVSAC